MPEINAWDGLRLLADWFDARIPNDTNPEVQSNLRVWAQDFIDLRARLAELEALLRQSEENERILAEAIGPSQDHRKQLINDLAALAPVVRAAVRYLLAREQRKASRGITPMMAAALGDLIAAVRALPADVLERLMALERMGVPHA